MLGALGIIAGIWAEKFDQLAAFQNFVVLPLTFLAGVFYSIHSLPPFWQAVSRLNPFFYAIDGFRYGFFGAVGRAALARASRLRPAPSLPYHGHPAPAPQRLQAAPLSGEADMVEPVIHRAVHPRGPRVHPPRGDAATARISRR